MRDIHNEMRKIRCFFSSLAWFVSFYWGWGRLFCDSARYALSGTARLLKGACKDSLSAPVVSLEAGGERHPWQENHPSTRYLAISSCPGCLSCQESAVWEASSKLAWVASLPSVPGQTSFGLPLQRGCLILKIKAS